MKSNLNLAVMPFPGSDGEDINWIPFMVIGHEDPTMLNKTELYYLSDEFWTEELREMYFNEDDHGDLSDEKLCDLFLEKAHELGYTVFPITSLSWVNGPKPLPLVTT